MGLSTLPYRYRINGVVSTDKTVMQNLETLCSAAQAWLTYDIAQGKWAVVINKTGVSVASFSDSNIIGSVSVQGTGLRDLYNSVRVEFPNIDLNDEYDFVEIAIPAGDRNPNEPDNTLNIQLDCINDPVMAEMIGLVELKQSRVDRVISFDVDYSYLGLKAGDLIDVTNSVLGYTNKVFRIISINEADGTDGSLVLSITALEYDAAVYNTDDLNRYSRSNANGIVTIGQINAPTTPIITGYELDPRPGIVVQTTVPAGLVEGIEFWLSYDNVNFTIIATERAVAGGVFTFGDTVAIDYDSLGAGNIYVKCRAFNATTSSEFSATATLAGFVPEQATDVITENTAVKNSSTGNLLLANGLLTILGGVDGILAGNTAPGTTGANLVNTISSSMIIPGAISISGANVTTTLNAAATGYTTNNGYDNTNVQNNRLVLPFTLNRSALLLSVTIKTPTGSFEYEYEDRTGSVETGQIAAQPAFVIQFLDGSSNVLEASTIDWTSSSTTFTVTNVAAGNYSISMFIIPTYDLDMNWSRGSLTSAEDVHKIFFTNFTSMSSTTAYINVLGTTA